MNEARQLQSTGVIHNPARVPAKELVVQIPKAHTSPPPKGQTGLGASSAAKKLCTRLESILSQTCSACSGQNANASALKGFLSAPLGVFPTPPSIPAFPEGEWPLPFYGAFRDHFCQAFSVEIHRTLSASTTAPWGAQSRGQGTRNSKGPAPSASPAISLTSFPDVTPSLAAVKKRPGGGDSLWCRWRELEP